MPPLERAAGSPDQVERIPSPPADDGGDVPPHSGGHDLCHASGVRSTDYGRREEPGELPVAVQAAPLLREPGYGGRLSPTARMRRQWSSSAWNRLAAALAESAPDAVIAVDRRGVICFANAESERVFGYARHEMLGRPLDMLIPEQSRAAHVAHLARYLTSPRPRPMGASSQLAAQRSDGSTFPADISLAPLDTPGGLIVAAIVRDVSERVAMEAERERLRELAERERQERRVQQAQRLESLGQLASGIATTSATC